jgi:hypothetical protein
LNFPFPPHGTGNSQVKEKEADDSQFKTINPVHMRKKISRHGAKYAKRYVTSQSLRSLRLGEENRRK